MHPFRRGKNLRHLATSFMVTLVSCTTNLAQESLPAVEQNMGITFQDTVAEMAIDSLSHDLGNIEPVNVELIKFIKYLGSDTLVITRVWTSDPHFICDYPRGRLIPGKIYPIKFCFWHKNRRGVMQKSMGFSLSDGSLVNYRFHGTYVSDKQIEIIPKSDRISR